MPGIDFAEVRSRIAIAEVLELLGFVVQQQRGSQVRGRCPLHESGKTRDRAFSVDLATNRYQCFKCGSKGGQVELWAAAKKLTVYQAAVDLCTRLGIETPWIYRW